jgi:acetyl esterase/lipase
MTQMQQATRRRFHHKILKRFAGVSTLALALASCSSVTIFNALVGVEPGGALLKRGEAYGAHPRQTLDVYRPEASGSAPVVVFFYGGSWRGGAKEDYAFVGRTMAARGFVTVIPDYRLVPDVHFPAFIDDSAAALTYVARNARMWGGDPGRIFLFGHSAGAYNAVMLAVTPKYLGEQGASRSIVRAVAGLAGPYDFLPFDGEITRTTFGAFPDPRATQPVSVADGKGPPLLLLHGAEDTTVYPKNSERLAARLHALGGRVEMRQYPGTGHVGIITSFSRTFRERSPALDDVVTFFDQHGARAGAAGRVAHGGDTRHAVAR